MSETSERIEKGKALAAKLFAGVERRPTAVMPDKLRDYTMGHLFGDVWQGDDLALEERSLITCVTLVALNRTAEQRLHFIGARNVGVPRAKIEAMLTHVAHYAGWPCAASAVQVLNEVWPEEA